MAWARSGRARVSASNPHAFGICDRCGFLYNHHMLRWQFDWRGAAVMNLRILVCDTCYDKPQEQLRAIVVPADPVPINNPRIQDYLSAETNYRTTSGQDTVNAQTNIPIPGNVQRITQDGNNRVTQQTGEPPGGLNQRPGVDPLGDPQVPGGDNPGLPLNNTTVPQTGTLVPGVGQKS